MKRKKFSASAGSFVLGEKMPNKIESRIHFGGKAACGGGNALAPESIQETSRKVADWINQLGWSKEVGRVVEKQLLRMPLSGDPREHARKLDTYYRGLGVKHHRAILEDLETGRREVVFQSGRWWNWVSGVSKAACADARHQVSGPGRTQHTQQPENFYLDKGRVSKRSYNEVFTIAGVSPEYVKDLLHKAESGGSLTPWERHNLAAVAVSAFYYSLHKWPNSEALEKLFKK